MSGAILRQAVTCLSVRFSYKQQNDNWNERDCQWFLNISQPISFKCRYVWMISPHIPTTCQPALLAEVLTWVPLPPAVSCKNCRLQTALCLVFGVCDWLSVLPPPHIHLAMTFFYYHDVFSDCCPRFRGSVPKYEKQNFDCPSSTENTISMICWSCVLETDFDTHTHTESICLN